MQLLHKLVVRAADSSQKLLTVSLFFKATEIRPSSGRDLGTFTFFQVVKNPVTNYLPVGSRKILMTFNTEELLLPSKLMSPKDEAPLVVAIGGIARGKVGA